jgi:hypothetical protein
MTHTFHLPLNEDQSIKVLRRLSIGIVGIIVFAVVQDMFQALRNNYSFYLSESLLYKVFWALFVPILYGWLRLYKQFLSKYRKGSLLLVLTIFAVVVHALLFSVSVYALSALLFDHSYPIVGNFTYTFSNDSILYLLIYGGFGLVLFRGDTITMPLQKNLQDDYIIPHVSEVHSEAHQPLNHGQNSSSLRFVSVGTGKHHVIVPIEDIIYITASAPYIALHTQKKEYLHNKTLKSMHQILPSEQFVRIHKSTIINVKTVVAYTSRLNGDYDIRLINGQNVRLSRNYAKEFMSQFERIAHNRHIPLLNDISSS